MHTLRCFLQASAVVAIAMFCTTQANADITLTLTETDGGVMVTFSDGSGTWDSNAADNLNFYVIGGSDSFLADGQAEQEASGSPTLSTPFGGSSDLIVALYTDFGPGFDSSIAFGFFDAPSGSPAMSDLNGTTVTLPGWDYSDFNEGTYTGLSDGGLNTGLAGQSITLIVGSTAVPEPGSFALLGMATVGIGVFRRRRTRA